MCVNLSGHVLLHLLSALSLQENVSFGVQVCIYLIIVCLCPYAYRCIYFPVSACVHENLYMHMHERMKPECHQQHFEIYQLVFSEWI